MNTNSNNDLIEARRDYTSGELRREQLLADPIAMFTQWLADARDAKLIDATAMSLATVDNAGKPHSRIVLLKQVDANGFYFYSNYDSDKGQQLAAQPDACLLFYWQVLERQVRIEGQVVRNDGASADEYFASRPEGSRFSAAASKQSSVVKDRSVLQEQVEQLHKSYPNGDVPRPANWGGFRLIPNYLEFWQGRSDRLHDRFAYSTAGTQWSVDRLSP